MGEVFLAFLKLGCTSFGGPIAHIGYFRDEFVGRRRWIDDAAYADLVALCNFLPGPASSQVGIALGISRAGLSGGLAAWLGFTLPSAAVLIAFAYGFSALASAGASPVFHGLKIAAVAVVAQAVWTMGARLSAGAVRASVTLAAAVLALAIPGVWAQLVAIVLGAITGYRMLEPAAGASARAAVFPVPERVAMAAWVVFFTLLALLPLIREASASPALELFDSFYRSGSLVFGGGHVVLPLLRNEVVPPGRVSDDIFLAGYGAAQAVPGPLFTFAAYLGAMMTRAPSGIAGGLLALVAIFLPAFLLVVGALPYWQRLKQSAAAQRALGGVNAAVVGLLLAALYNPVFVSSVRAPADFALALAAFGLLAIWKVSPLTVVVLTALGGVALSLLG